MRYNLLCCSCDARVPRLRVANRRPRPHPHEDCSRRHRTPASPVDEGGGIIPYCTFLRCHSVGIPYTLKSKRTAKCRMGPPPSFIHLRERDRRVGIRTHPASVRLRHEDHEYPSNPRSDAEGIGSKFSQLVAIAYINSCIFDFKISYTFFFGLIVFFSKPQSAFTMSHN